MHPSPAFRWDDRRGVLAYIAERGFAHIFATTPDGPRVAHAPVIVMGGALRFHLARGNALAALLDGTRALVSVSGPDAYVSPDWYGSANQVPTWNYLAAEAEGRVRRLDESELTAQADALSAAHEARLAKPPWTRAKMSPGQFEAMLTGIVGFEITIETLRGTCKLGQNKRGSDVDGLIEGLRDNGRADVATLVASVHGR